MAVAWPSTVPQKFEQRSYNYDPQSGLLRTDMDTGYAKVRRRSTAISKYHSGIIILTNTESQDFETWFYTTGGFGTVDFDITDPRNELNTITCRFLAPTGQKVYSLKPNGDTLDWELSFTMEELP